MISTLEVMRGNIVLFEGKTYRVQTIGDYILLEGRKEWIGGSMINGEPISEVWLERFLFEKMDSSIWNKKGFNLWKNADGKYETNYSSFKFEYVHQLQIAYFSFTGEHLKVPKLKP